MYRRTTLISVLIGLFFLPAFTLAMPPKGGAEATFSGLPTLSRGLFTGSSFSVDQRVHYMHGTLYFTDKTGPSDVRFDGNVDAQTGALKASFSGNDDMNFVADKNDRQTSYLRTVFDGTMEATLAPRQSEGAPYIWEGPVVVSYLTVIVRQSPLAAPKEKTVYNGRIRLVVDAAAVVGVKVPGVNAPKKPLVSVKPPATVTNAEELTSSEGAKEGKTATTTAVTLPKNDTGRRTLMVIILLLALAGIVGLAWPRKPIA